ncbi:MAG: hypothetical protein SGPRY_005804 [Prymnesium sp.]
MKHGGSFLPPSARLQDELGLSLGSHDLPKCGIQQKDDCYLSGCCSPPLKCLKSQFFETARCMRACPRDDTWGTCWVWQRRAAPLSSEGREEEVREPWQRPPLPNGVCAESAARPAGGLMQCSGDLQHRDAVAFCREQGARLCTAEELSSRVARGS